MTNIHYYLSYKTKSSSFLTEQINNIFSEWADKMDREDNIKFNKCSLSVFHGQDYLPIGINVYDDIDILNFCIVDITGMIPFYSYLLGILHGKGKPVLLLSDYSENLRFPPEWANPVVEYYSDSIMIVPKHLENLVAAIYNHIKIGLMNPEKYILSKEQRIKKIKPMIFISYSHNDSIWLDRLMIHLRPLERDN